MANKSLPPVQPVVGMPSADLVTYRFDQLDSEIKELHKKLDSISVSFATKEEIVVLEKRMDNWVWFARAVVVALLTSVAMAGAALIGKK